MKPSAGTMNRFSKQSFESCEGEARAALVRELAAVLTGRIVGAPKFHLRVRELVTELRALGHDLWSFDEDDDVEVWLPSWATPSGPGLVVSFTPDRVSVEWSEAAPPSE
jgi:hypothetical protein